MEFPSSKFFLWTSQLVVGWTARMFTAWASKHLELDLPLGLEVPWGGHGRSLTVGNKLPSTLWSMEIALKFSPYMGLIRGSRWLDDLVGGLEHSLFFHMLGIIIPSDWYCPDGLKPPKYPLVNGNSSTKALDVVRTSNLGSWNGHWSGQLT